jgi:phosphatidylserine/phosphatidylglycerophosphate/cardiolipin synthase-like enzyme
MKLFCCSPVLNLMITRAPIAQALGAAERRGVKVRLILDKSQRTEKYSPADIVTHAGIPAFVDPKHAIAHNQIMVIDGKTILTGSFNFTTAAEPGNAENPPVIQDVSPAKKYAANRNRHSQHSDPYPSKSSQ